jgi:hypothetical protein
MFPLIISDVTGAVRMQLCPKVFDESGGSSDNSNIPWCGPVAQLGARFHGMEEVIGSIPIRSTNQSNNLGRASVQWQSVCVTVCVITRSP